VLRSNRNVASETSNASSSALNVRLVQREPNDRCDQRNSSRKVNESRRQRDHSHNRDAWKLREHSRNRDAWKLREHNRNRDAWKLRERSHNRDLRRKHHAPNRNRGLRRQRHAPSRNPDLLPQHRVLSRSNRNNKSRSGRHHPRKAVVRAKARNHN
jgi:hypothetical protein